MKNAYIFFSRLMRDDLDVSRPCLIFLYMGWAFFSRSFSKHTCTLSLTNSHSLFFFFFFNSYYFIPCVAHAYSLISVAGCGGGARCATCLLCDTQSVTLPSDSDRVLMSWLLPNHWYTPSRFSRETRQGEERTGKKGKQRKKRGERKERGRTTTAWPRRPSAPYRRVTSSMYECLSVCLSVCMYHHVCTYRT
jgi:hypothetical protein